MSKCPECGGRLQQVISAYTLTTTGRVQDREPGARCQNVAHCDYIAISEDRPDIPHPNLPNLRMTLAKNKAFRQYSNALAPLIPETERDPDRCGGRPVFTRSRLPVEVIIGQVTAGVSNDEIIENYPRMNLFLLAVIRSIVQSRPHLVDQIES